MKFLALGDSQFGATTVPLVEQEKVWDKIVDVAIDRRVDAVVHGGDLLEGPTVEGQHLAAFRRPLARLRAAGIPMLLVRGNHDSAVRPVDALDVFHEYPLLRVAQRPEAHFIGGVSFCCLPWVHRGRLLAHLNGQGDHDSANLTVSAMLVQIAEHLARRVEPGVPKVLVAHWAISGSALPTGLPVDELREPILPWAELDTLGFDLIIGAHIHQSQQISRDGLDATLGVVLGSPQQLSFGEHGEHGCWIFDVAAGEGAVAEFVSIESPRFVTVTVADELVDGKVYLPGALSTLECEGDYIRFRYIATEDQARAIDHAAIQRSILEAGAASVKIEPQIMRTARARAEGISEQLSQVEALAQWCDANDVQGEIREQVIARFQEWA